MFLPERALGYSQQLLGFIATSVFDRHQLDGLFRDVFGADFELLDQFPGSAGIAEPVFDSYCTCDDRQAIEFRAAGDDITDAPGETANLVFFGWVSAADTVSIRCLNNSGSSTDPASGVFKVVVTHF